MQASPTGFDQSLTLVWQGSILLAGLSLAILLALIVKRWINTHQQARMAARKDALAALIQAALSAPIPPSRETLPPLPAADRPIVHLLALDILRTVLGADAERLVDILRVWKMEPYFRRELRSRSRGRRIQALTLLAYFPSEETTRVLMQHIPENDPYVQMAALRGLAGPQHIAQLPKVVELLAASAQRNTAMLADILQRFGPQAVSSLVALAEGAERIEIRLAAIVALARIGDFAAVPALCALVGAAERDVRAQAVSALGQIGDTSAAPVILKAIEDPETAVRIRAVQIAGMFKLQEAIPLLAQQLDAEDWWLRFRAAEALYAIGGSAMALLKALSGGNDRTGHIAAEVLAEKETALV